MPLWLHYSLCITVGVEQVLQNYMFEAVWSFLFQWTDCLMSPYRYCKLISLSLGTDLLRHRTKLRKAQETEIRLIQNMHLRLYRATCVRYTSQTVFGTTKKLKIHNTAIPCENWVHGGTHNGHKPNPTTNGHLCKPKLLKALPPQGTWTHHWRSEGRPPRTLELVAQGSKPSTDGMNVGREITKSSLPRGVHELTLRLQPCSSWGGESDLSSTWELKSCMLQRLKTVSRHAQQLNRQSDIIRQLK